MQQRGLGGLADLAKIMEEASDSTSCHREDRQALAPTTPVPHRAHLSRREQEVKPKGSYEKRLQKQAKVPSVKAKAKAAPEVSNLPAVAKVSGAITVDFLAAIKQVAQPQKISRAASQARPEAWKRKPGDPVF
jgi:hypothetical protein